MCTFYCTFPCLNKSQHSTVLLQLQTLLIFWWKLKWISSRLKWLVLSRLHNPILSPLSPRLFEFFVETDQLRLCCILCIRNIGKISWKFCWISFFFLNDMLSKTITSTKFSPLHGVMKLLQKMYSEVSAALN